MKGSGSTRTNPAKKLATPEHIDAFLSSHAWKGNMKFVDTNAFFSHKYDDKIANQVHDVVHQDLNYFAPNPVLESKTVKISDIYPYQVAQGTKKVKELSESIRKEGQKEPCNAVVVGDKIYILDGHHRVSAMSVLGMKRVKINILKKYSQREFDERVSKL